MKISIRAIVGTLVGTIGAVIVAAIVKSILIILFHDHEMMGLIFNPNMELIVDYRVRIISVIAILSALLVTVYHGMKVIPNDHLKKYGRIVVVSVPILYFLIFASGMFAPKWIFLCAFAVLGIWYHFRDELTRKEAMMGLIIAIVGGAIVSELIIVVGMNLSKGQLIDFLMGVEAESNIKQAWNLTHYYIYQGLGITAFLACVYIGFKRIPAQHYKWTFLYALSVLPLLHSDRNLQIAAGIGFLAIYFYLRKEKESEADLSFRTSLAMNDPHEIDQ